MSISNFERLVQLADEVFASKNDPHQLDVNQEVIERLKSIHPATVSEYDDGNGSVAWVLVIPTTLDLMDQFIDNRISEKELYDLTPPDIAYEALYLCAALVLKEYRGKGIAKQLTLNAVENIRKDHPLKSLFIWVFTQEGDSLSETISQLTSLPLLKRGE